MSQRSHIANSGSSEMSACSAAWSAETRVGIAERGFDCFAEWVADTARLLGRCPCRSGCPSCVQSPKCGNLNELLDKAAALILLERMGDAG